MSQPVKLLVTHHAPDLDAVTSLWLLKRFDAQRFAIAQLAFVNPGETLPPEAAAAAQAIPSEIVHTDTGKGEFDHHQPERAQQQICASSLVYDYLCQVHPDLLGDQALKEMVAFTTQIDHFQEIFWDEAHELRFVYSLPEVLEGLSLTNLHSDDSIVHFALQALDAVYSNMTQEIKARSLITEIGTSFELSFGKVLAIETENDLVIKVAQKLGFVMVIKKDGQTGHARIKARPDAKVDLKALSDAISATQDTGTWFYHPSGKMLLNSSRKHQNHLPTQLSLMQLVQLTKEAYAH